MKGSGAGRRIDDRWRLGQKVGAVGTDYTTVTLTFRWSGGIAGPVGKKALLHCKIGIAWIVLCQAPKVKFGVQ